jgi:coenzyme F420 hydrogenase subunit beta
MVRTKKELLDAMGSRYCPVKPQFRMEDLIDEKGKIAIVGLPCHIWAFRNLANINTQLRNSFFVLDYYAERLQIFMQLTILKKEKLK